MTDKTMFDSLKYQVGSDHYKGLSIEPAQYIIKNNLLFPEGNVIKYTTRHDYWKRKKIPTKDLPKIKSKGKKSIEKAIHYLEMILERDYAEIWKILVWKL